MTTIATEQASEGVNTRKERYVSYSKCYKPKPDGGLSLLPEYMAYNLTHPRKRQHVDYTRFSKNPTHN